MTAISADDVTSLGTDTVYVALVEDHHIVGLGFAEALRAEPDIDVVGVVPTVGDLAHFVDLDLVVLDLRLNDGSTPEENVAAIHELGARVLVLTSAENPVLVREAARAGVLGIVRKSQSVEQLVHAVREGAAGRSVATLEWAAALDSDVALADANLSDREREILALYASGESAQSVAFAMGLSRNTVASYVSRIRDKYARVGRPAFTKVDLHLRAAEDGLLGGE